jgi:HEAT repeat protein
MILPLAKVEASQGSSIKDLWKSPWVLGGIGATSLVGATAVVLSRRFGQGSEAARQTEDASEERAVNEKMLLPEGKPLDESLSISDTSQTELRNSRIAFSDTATKAKEFVDPAGSVVAEGAKTLNSQVSETTRLPKINIVDELVQELRTPDSAKRQKVIWELGQRGDTRAVQPLVDLMLDSDSRQRSLILSSLSEIGTRTLKPLTRALAISLQDENAEVRKNAIRDLTRVYDMVAQISHLLTKASDDPDREVQETARWALGQLNRIRSTGVEALPAAKNGVSPPENLL